MDINKLRPTEISAVAREKVIFDFFPELASSDELSALESQLDSKSAPLHAGALCLYATTLITKLHEDNPWSLEPHCKEREASYISLIKSNPKHSNLTDEEVATFAKNLIAKDIRNCFAHGSFDISYDIHTKKLNYVLYPNRKDFVTPEPIVISKQSLLAANKKFLHKKGRTYSYFPEHLIDGEISNHLDRALKGFILPMQLMELSRFYLDKSVTKKSDIMFQEKMYYLIQYALLAAKITYDQDDYYKIFGKSSNMFESISLIRNSLAHDSLHFVDNAQNVSYADKHGELSESVSKSASRLLIVDMQKQLIMRMQQNSTPHHVEIITTTCKEIFDFFFDGTHDFEELMKQSFDEESEK